MDDLVKPCPMCRKQISQKARKCPYCHQFQGWARFTIIALSVSPVLLFALLVTPIFLTIDSLRDFASEDTAFEDYPDAIQVVESLISFGQSPEGEPTVVVTGTVKNNSDLNWKELYMEVAFRGPDGKLVDVGHRRDVVLIVRAGDTANFKVSTPREFPEAQYTSHVARVKWAKEISAFP